MASIDFGELSNDDDFKSRISDFNDSLKNVEEILDLFCSISSYDSLTKEDKVRFGLFQSFAINSLFWLYLRTQGIDPNQHELKGEINRVKEYMSKSKRLHDRKSMPRLDQEAAKRFIRNGLWAPNQAGPHARPTNDDEKHSEQYDESGPELSRKRKLDEIDD